jgi:hypothetical protein
MSLNQIRGDTQLRAGTTPASALNDQFSASDGDLFVDKEDHTTETDGRAIFIFAATPVVGSEHVFLRGLLRTDGYTMTGPQLTFDAAPDPGDALAFSYRKLVA